MTKYLMFFNILMFPTLLPHMRLWFILHVCCNSVRCIHQRKKLQKIFLCLEIRVVFCVGDTEPSSPQYLHFMQCLKSFQECPQIYPHFIKQVDVINHSVQSIPKYFEGIDRPAKMELMEVRLTYAEVR